MIDTFLMVSRSSITVQSLGQIELGCRYENMVFFLSRSVCDALFVRGAHSLNKYCRHLRIDFDSVFSFFSEGIAVSHVVDSSHFCR